MWQKGESCETETESKSAGSKAKKVGSRLLEG